ncbi:MAG TPA: choice-of-anchor D domain-containing protein [Pseudonocardiaceae bacterium]|nr:choice-of-anchor D domain-containing protein [Pseudonocardiaceae bacterium]
MAKRVYRLRTAGMVLVLVAAGVMAAGGGAEAAPSNGSTEQVSVRDDGSPAACVECATGGSAISSDGRYVAFATSAALDPLAQGETDVYIRDRATPGHTVLISRASTGAANGSSRDPSLSADGRYIAFDTGASDLDAVNFPSGDAGNGNGTTDVVICDRDPGGGSGQRCLILGDVSTNAAGHRQYSNFLPTVSADGMTVAFQQSSATQPGLVTNVVVSLNKDANGDLQVPSADAYVHVNVDPAPIGSQVTIGLPRLSADGGHVAFVAAYRPATTAAEVRGAGPVHLADVVTGATPNPPSCGDVVEVADSLDAGSAATVVSVDGTGTPLAGTIDQGMPPAISADGSVVAFDFLNSSPCGETGTDAVGQVLVVDRDPGHAGVLGPVNGAPVEEFMASADTAGQPSQNGAYEPALSADGRYVAFDATGPNLDNGPAPNGFSQVMQRDLILDRQRAATGLPRLPAELASTCGEACDGDSDQPVLDANGGVVAFLSDADNLVPGENSGQELNFFARQYLPTVTAAPLAFGTIAQGSTAEATITLSQQGFGPVSIGRLSIAGPDTSDFTIFPSQTCVGTTLYETGQCLVSIRYAPQAPGDRTATLVVTAPVPASVPLSGGSGPPINGFLATPNPVAFPGQRLALTPSSPQTVTVANTSAAPFTITGVSLPAGPGLYPGDYAIETDSCLGATLAPGATCAVVIVEVPLGAGRRPAAVAFTDTTGGSPQIVGLTAIATTPAIRVSPAVTPGGRVTTIRGQGFPANFPVTVGVPAQPATPVLRTRTDAAGNFSIALPVFQDADVGTWFVRAAANGLDLSASAPLLIVLGTFQPPDFTTRH